jgi:hypothetical protein
VSFGCDVQKPELTQPRASPPDISAYVTGDAARHLRAGGRFDIDNAAPDASGPTIDAARAADLALAFVRTFAHVEQRWWEEERGGGIDVSALRADPRIYLARTPYDPLPPGRLHPAYRRGFGSYYIVRLLSGQEPVLAVAVSALDTDVGIDRDGKVLLPAFGGNEFVVNGISLDATRFRPNVPEEAVERVGARFGVRVDRTPELVLRGRGWSPLGALWKLSLEHEVSVRGKDRAFTAGTREIYVGPGGTMFVPGPRQPASWRGNVMVGPPFPGPMTTVDVPVRPGVQAEFEPVVPTTSR